jgi:cation transport regulator ChaC
MFARVSSSPCWVFGYGSLIWRPTFPFAEQRPGWIEGWARRFWQGSTDHRGVPGAPGRVVTLVPQVGARCFGVAYRLHDADRETVLAHLDHREKGGYARHEVAFHTTSAGGPIRALVYIATEANPEYLGPAPLQALVAQIRHARGPSGANTEYVLRLAEALRSLDAEDEHVFALADALAATS